MENLLKSGVVTEVDLREIIENSNDFVFLLVRQTNKSGQFLGYRLITIGDGGKVLHEPNEKIEENVNSGELLYYVHSECKYEVGDFLHRVSTSLKEGVLEYKTRSGRWVRHKIVPIENGAVLVNYINDITIDRERVQLEMGRAEGTGRLLELIELAFNKTGVPMIVTYPDFTIVYVNSSACKLIGKNKGDFLCKPFFEVIVPEDVSCFKETLKDKGRVETVGEINGKLVYTRCEALYNDVLHGYAFYLSNYTLSTKVNELLEVLHRRGQET